MFNPCVPAIPRSSVTRYVARFYQADGTRVMGKVQATTHARTDELARNAVKAWKNLDGVEVNYKILAVVPR